MLSSCLSVVVAVNLLILCAGQQEIINGVAVNHKDFPMAVRVNTFKGDSRWACGGALIGKKVVLTAAHCIDTLKGETLKSGSNPSATLGVECMVWNSNAQKSEVILGASIKIHPKWNAQAIQDDYGLIFLDKEVPGAQPVKLPNDGDTGPQDGTTCTVVGWGTTEKGTLSQGQLMKVDMPIVPNKDCYWQQKYPHDSYFCAGVSGGGDQTKAKGTCGGDSGGPVMCDYSNSGFVEYGIVSFGQSGTCMESTHGGYAKVTKELKWIKDNMGGGGSAPAPTPAPSDCKTTADVKKDLANKATAGDCTSEQCNGQHCFYKTYCSGYYWGPTYVKCNDGKCLNANYVCDGDDDCVGGEDESGCP
jgi:secreted trypsin-like serine protease